MSRKEIKRAEDSINESKVRCSCGHTFPALPTKEKVTCGHCHRLVRNNSLSRFRYMYYKSKGNIKCFL